MIFLGISLACYAALTWWLTGRAGGTTEEWTYTLLHLTLAAAINTHLFYVVRRRSLSFLACPPLAYLVVSQVYFTINGLKYFSPNILYPQFDLSLKQQFAGSAAGAAVLFLCSLVLYRVRGPTTAGVLAWLRGHWPDVQRIVIGSTAGSVACKLLLFALGYGSTYTDAAYSEHAVRSYADYFVLLGNDVFGSLSLAFGLLYLCHPRMGRARPLTTLVAALGVLLQVLYVLLYMKARLIVILATILTAFALEAISRRRAERVLQAMLIMLPPASLLGVQLTLLIGRVNLPEETGVRIAIGAVNRRAELTDFATAILVNSHGTAHDASIVSAALLNAIPRAVFPRKMEVVKDVYSEILEQKLGWPAGYGENIQADYLDTSFSNGVMSFGYLGFVLVPLGITLLLSWLGGWLDRSLHGASYGIGLVALTLTAMHIEGEWGWIPANFRQALFVSLLAAALVMVGRMLHHILVVATTTPVEADSHLS